MNQIIDFRVRPPYKSYLSMYKDGGPGKWRGMDTIHGYLDSLAIPTAESIENADLRKLIKEYNEYGVVKAVVAGRKGVTNVENQDLENLSIEYPDIFIPFPCLDVRRSLEENKLEIEHFIFNGHGRGVIIEPVIFQKEVDDKDIFPLYSYLEKNDIPVMITFYADARQDGPSRIERIAQSFPKLKLILSHAGYPQVLQMINLAFRYSGIYLLPDIYGFTVPGSDSYQSAARTIAQGKILFGTAYPLSSIGFAVDNVMQTWRLTEEQLNDVFYNTAAKLLKL